MNSLGIIGAFWIKKQIEKQSRPKILEFGVVRLVLGLISLASLPLFLQHLNQLEATGADQNTYFFFFLPIIEKMVNLIIIFFVYSFCLLGYLGKQSNSKCISRLR